MFRLFDAPVEKPNPGTVAYRYYDHKVNPVYFGYEFEDSFLKHCVTEISCQEWEVCGFTPKGFYIRCGTGKEPRKWIGHAWRKKFAHLCQADAQNSFVHRKKAQIRKLNDQLSTAETALAAAQSGHWGGKCPPIHTLNLLTSGFNATIQD